MTLITLQAKVTKTAAFDGAGVDISGLSADSTIKVRVSALTAGRRARFVLYDSVDAFSAKIPVAAFAVVGEISGEAVIRSFNKRSGAYARFSTGSAELRLSLDAIDANASIDYEAWIE
jgi:hypothetical protein